MTARHSVKIDGTWYRAGEELPEQKAPDDPPAENYTKGKIMFMKTEDLRELATKEGVTSEPEKLSASELRKMLLKHFGM